MKITQDLIEDIRDEIRVYAEESGKYLSLVVFGLVSDGFSLEEITTIKIGDIDTDLRIVVMNGNPCLISEETNKDIINYIESMTETRILRIILDRDKSLRLIDIGHAIGMDSDGATSGLKYNYLNRLVDQGAIEESMNGKVREYSTTENRLNSFLNNLYLTRFRPDHKSTRESLRGHFKTALEISDMDITLTPRYFKKNTISC